MNLDLVLNSDAFHFLVDLEFTFSALPDLDLIILF